MAMKSVIVLLLAVCCMSLVHPSKSQLSQDFYKTSCPQAEAIVKKVIERESNKTMAVAAGIVRTFFHDCILGGCDGSILIKSPKSEKCTNQNLLGPSNALQDVKAEIESVCPGVVSCADILAMAARDAAVWASVPPFKISLGRRDGEEPLACNAEEKLPQPEFKVEQLEPFFTSRNMTIEDMVALSGAHSLGISHCPPVEKRLYPLDPTLNKTYAEEILMKNCTQGGNNPDAFVPLDPDSIFHINNTYYNLLLKGMGLFTSDQDLYLNPTTKETVLRFANDNAAFQESFAKAMEKLGHVGVKTGTQGVIRHVC